jgi:hypothetical protein
VAIIEEGTAGATRISHQVTLRATSRAMLPVMSRIMVLDTATQAELSSLPKAWFPGLAFSTLDADTGTAMAITFIAAAGTAGGNTGSCS